MTFAELVTSVMGRLNLTSDDAKVRIGGEINDRYARVRTSTGMVTSNRVTVSAAATSGRDALMFVGVEKVLTVYNPSLPPLSQPLDEVSFLDFRTMPKLTEPPTAYAIDRIRARSVTIRVNCTASADGSFTLNADGYEEAIELTGDLEPAFSASFHDILLHGAMADELLKLEKPELAADRENKYELRLAELRYEIAKSAARRVYSGRRLGNRPGFPLIVT